MTKQGTMIQTVPSEDPFSEMVIGRIVSAHLLPGDEVVFGQELGNFPSTGDIVLDFQDVEIICSGTIKKLLDKATALRESGGQLKLVNVHPAVYSVLEITGLKNIIPVVLQEDVSEDDVIEAGDIL